MSIWKETETSEYLKISPMTLRIWRHKKQGPPWIKLGKCVRYDSASVEAWAKRQEVRP